MELSDTMKRKFKYRLEWLIPQGIVPNVGTIVKEQA